VHAALLAWLSSIATRARWPEELRARMIATSIAARAIALEPPAMPRPTSRSGGVIAETVLLVESAAPYWESVDPEIAASWARDRAILGVAGRARAERLARAFAHFSR
jgi:acyl-CoA dehydrogenase